MTETKVLNIINLIKELTLIEANTLIKNLKTEFNYIEKEKTINLESSVKVNEKTEFSLILKSVPQDKKIAILKIIKKTLDLNLKEAKIFVESTPKVIKEKLSKEIALSLKKELEEVGAIVEMK